ncbi:ABC-2 family transporter protein [Paenibacillus woosongensis]|uniref:ABC-2 family transporter protein n=1 Tax=Paenibacillus woosongensis TaxID=307580 RepID=A0AA95KSM6_9BACL|nr:ABC-2 family transporter protein [Paenibacillus woosongensis]WHX47768.1 ABC-2 family transporter protein [Paenibacillus woosongensis]
MMEYSADFYVMIGAAAMTQITGFLFLWVVFSRIPDIQGWQFWEVAFMYAAVYVSEGMGSLFFEGTWRMLRLVNMGELDRYLVRPMPVVLQIFCTGIGINGLGNIVIGGTIMGMALSQIEIAWSPATAGMAVVLLGAAMIIRVAINLAANCSAFWIRNSGNAFPIMIHNLSEFAKYPMTIFSLGLQLFISIVVPFAFVSFVPAAALFGKATWSYLGWFSPLVALYCWGLALLLLRIGLRRYESAGN